MLRMTVTRFPCSKYGPADGSFGCGSHTRMVSTSVVAKPVSTDCSFHRLRTSRPAPASSTSAMATCATTRMLRARARAPPGTPFPADFKCSLTSVRADWMAGPNATSRPAITAVSMANKNTR
jgi:hypothetical protein